MKKVTLIICLVLVAILSSPANTLLWGTTAANKVYDQNNILIPTSKTDGTVGAFAQLIWVGLDGNVDDFVYSGTGVSGDDVVISVNYSFGASYLGTSGLGSFNLTSSGISQTMTVVARVYNAANPDYASGTNAVITGSSISYYWQSNPYTFTYNELAADDQWNFTGGSDIQTTTAVPEPATFLLFGMGAFGAWLIRRNKLKAKEEA